MFGKKSRFGFGLNLGPLSFSLGNTTKKSWASLHAFFDRVLTSGAGKKTVSSQLEEYRSWVYIAASVIYRRVGTIPFKFYRNDNDEEIKKDNPVYPTISKIFIDPNPFMEYRFVKQFIQLQLDLTGAAFLLREDDPFGRPARIWPMITNNLYKIEKGDTFKDWIKGYTFKVGNQYVTYRADNIMYFHYPDPKDPRDFCSPIKAQAYAIDIDHYIEVYERDFFKNSARPDMAIAYPENVEFEEEDAKRVIDMWKQKFQGEGHFHEVALLDRGAEIKDITPKNEDLALMTLASWSQQKVLAAYNVPPGKVGIVKDVNKSNAIGIDITFNSECIKPRLDLQDEVITRGILQRFDPRLEIRHSNPIPRDREQDIDEIKQKVGVPIWTINEAREMEGGKPVDGGDIIYVPLNFIPLSSGGFKEPKEPKEPPEGEEGRVIVIKDREYSDDWLSKKWYAFKAYTEGWESIWKARLKALFEDQQEEVLENLEAYWDEIRSVFHLEEKILENFGERWKGFQEGFQDKLAQEITKYFNDNPEVIQKLTIEKDSGLQKIALDGVLKKKGTEKVLEDLSGYIQTKQKEAIDYILFDWKENKKIFDKAGKQITGSLIVEAANEELIALGLEASFSLENKLARKYLGDKVAEFSKEVLSTKADQLRRTLTEGFKKGEDIRRLSERVQKVYDGVIKGKYEALRIARTETISASNAGSFMGYEDSGVVKEKGWLSTRDQRTRGAKTGDKADHYHMDGQRVKLKEAFVDPRTGARMKYPGDTSLGAGGIDTVMCRCTIVSYVTEKETEEE